MLRLVRCGGSSPLPSPFCSLVYSTHHTKPVEVVAITSVVVAPVRNRTVVSRVVPAAAAKTTVVVGEGIPTPFIHVTAHVVQSVAVGFLLCYRMCSSIAVLLIPCDFVYIVTSCVLIVLSAFCSIFPFSFCWQSETVCLLWSLQEKKFVFS